MLQPVYDSVDSQFGRRHNMRNCTCVYSHFIWLGLNDEWTIHRVIIPKFGNIITLITISRVYVQSSFYSGIYCYHFIFIVFLFSFSELQLADGAEEPKFYPNMSLHPYFDFDVPRNVTARVGQTAFLHCRVEQLGDKSVISLTIQIFSIYGAVFLFIKKACLAKPDK